ncbi:MAG: uracil-DNA glycosylase [Synergistales bacterium]|nr:uracil-DNA glycosylase [Synergistales bacterium]MDY6401228.1 uracil-DNA glycosylase [Synergistales bacterium]MDY6404432.1 uracil-DNA glycosylase [Synergistales bacterium]MDY6410209.1 uracil-DNA glycosylase [Synergistales bacterium]MDY6414961.1 uracil-DNA glycosylase [Synergistales bacterium]
MSIDINSAWEELKNRVQNCQKCKLCENRHNTVFGEGPVENCKVMIIGEGPGEEEDLSGRPFVGPAGQLLTKILEQGGGIPRNSVYIANIVKCRPPNNRNPAQEEMLACNEYIEAQLLLLRPEIVVAMGSISAQWLLKSKQGITKLRGQWLDWRGIKLFPMFHPSYLLRNASRAKGSPKDLTWQDIKALKLKIDELDEKN